MKQRELVRMLLHKAAQDEAAMIRLMTDPDLDDEIVGFHAQQAVEKSLKAWLAHLGADYPKVHSIETLLELLAMHGHSFPNDIDVARLTPFATVFRYDDLPLAAGLDRASALRMVRFVLTLVEKATAEDTTASS